MKRVFILFFFLWASSLFVSAQICGSCSIDYSYTNPGVYPDTLPAATAGSEYEADLTIVLQADTTVEIFGTPVTLAFLNYHIMEPVGLPYGMHVSTDLGDFPVDYNPADGLYGCARVCGTPLVAGWYAIEVPLIATLEYPGGDNSGEYTLYLQVLPAGSDGALATSATFGCDPLAVSFETPVHSYGVEGFTYSWDFGNGNLSNLEFPPAQTYTATGDTITQYIVNHTITIDTIGYQIDYVTVNATNCNDCAIIIGCTGLTDAEKPDLYIQIDELGVDTWPGITDTNPPVTFTLGDPVDPGTNYHLHVKDQDGGATGDDDNCGNYIFSGGATGVTTLTGGGSTVEISITHPVISLTYTDTITVYPNASTPALVVGGGTELCEGDSTVLSAVGSPAYSYQWYDTLSPIPGAAAMQYTVTSTGTYSVIATAEGGCAASSDSVHIDVFDNPPTPAVLVSGGNVLSTSSDYALQWYYEGSPIPGADAESYTVALAGHYFVSAENGPCISYSDTVFIDPGNSVQGTSAGIGSCSAVPGFAAGTFVLKFNSSFPGDADIAVYDMQGRCVLHKRLHYAAGVTQQDIDLSGFAPGLYAICLRSGAFMHTEKVVK